MKRQLSLFLSLSLQITLLFLWLLSALDKIFHFTLFREALILQPFPGWAAVVLAYLLPAAELSIAALLALQKYINIALRASSILLLAYTNYVGMVIFLGASSYICKCNLLIEQLGWHQHLILNFAFLISSIGAERMNRLQQQSSSSRGAAAEGPSAKRQYN
ncbi:MauE/DoxX family redox-associated membrane protein [Sphingobacterium suaedae]|uniref:MauE/DoxX family redox-associated membrane protein n=1 Tax=Sphingobacterium suaedae TaxID=1686402 RepID=A0ABW5KNF8_9SPHI